MTFQTRYISQSVISRILNYNTINKYTDTHVTQIGLWFQQISSSTTQQWTNLDYRKQLIKIKSSSRYQLQNILKQFFKK